MSVFWSHASQCGIRLRSKSTAPAPRLRSRLMVVDILFAAGPSRRSKGIWTARRWSSSNFRAALSRRGGMRPQNMHVHLTFETKPLPARLCSSKGCGSTTIAEDRAGLRGCLRIEPDGKRAKIAVAAAGRHGLLGEEAAGYQQTIKSVPLLSSPAELLRFRFGSTHDTIINLATHIPSSMLATLRRSAWRENDGIRSLGSRSIAEVALEAGVSSVIQESIGFA